MTDQTPPQLVYQPSMQSKISFIEREIELLSGLCQVEFEELGPGLSEVSDLMLEITSHQSWVIRALSRI